MSDILTNLWLNIDRFSYKDTNYLKITQDDVRILDKVTRRMIYLPTMTFLMIYALKKYRANLSKSFKRIFLGDKKLTRTLSDIKVTPKEDVPVTPKEKIVFEYNTHSEINDHNATRLTILESRKISSRKDKYNPVTINETFKSPTTRELYFANSTRNFKESLHKKFKTPSKFMIERFIKAKDYLSRTKLIYFPVFIVFVVCLVDVVVAYIGLYFKYQPLVDEYYNQEILKNKI